jgi:hypothetical protein
MDGVSPGDSLEPYRLQTASKNERAATTPWMGKPGLVGKPPIALNFSASTAGLKLAFNIPVRRLLLRLAGLKAEYT